MKISVIAAVSSSGVLGLKGQLPWHLPEDLKHFRTETQGHGVIMGRKTYEGLGRALPQRLNIVLSSQPGFWPVGGIGVSSLAQAILVAAGTHKVHKAFVIGGAQIYKAALPICDEALITVVKAPADLEGDVFFDFNWLSGMKLVSESHFPKDHANEYDMTFQRWVR